MTAAAFVDIIVSPEIRDNLEEVYIEIEYVPADLPPGTIESTLKLYLWDTASGTWNLVPDSGVNTDEHYIYGTVNHLSTYGAFGELEEDDEDDDTNGGGGGEGGGGGGGGRGVTSLSSLLTPEGRLVKDTIALSSDLRVYLTLPNGTYCRYPGNAPVYWIFIEALPEDGGEWPVPAGSTRVMPVYEMSPAGATFSPPISCTFRYKDSDLPAGANENHLVAMRWQPATNQWERLPSQVDEAANTVTTTIGNFSFYTLMLSPRPAEFELSEFYISSNEIDINEEVTIRVLVTNTGDLSGDYDVILRVNYDIADIKVVTLAGGDSEYVDFKISQEATGTYTISVNELTSEFIVKPIALPEPEPEPEAEIEPTPTSEITPEPEQPEITETDTQPEIRPTKRTTQETAAMVRWWMFGVLFGIAAILGIAFFIVSKRQKS